VIVCTRSKTPLLPSRSHQYVLPYTLNQGQVWGPQYQISATCLSLLAEIHIRPVLQGTAVTLDLGFGDNNHPPAQA
jgi:hypothetical protein